MVHLHGCLPLYVLCAAAWLTGSVGGALAQNTAAEGICDSLRPVSSALGYKVRQPSVRCEGLYESTVRAVGLEVVSFVSEPLEFDLQRDEVIEIIGPDLSAVAGGRDMPLRVRAVALPLKTYYRMDAVLGSNARVDWPVADVLRPAGLEASQIGLFGWLGTEADKTFVPVRVARSGASGIEVSTPRNEAMLYLRVTSDAEEVLWRRREGDTVSEWHPAGGGRLRAGQTTIVRLEAGDAPEVGIDIAAKPIASDSWTSLRLNALLIVP